MLYPFMKLEGKSALFLSLPTTLKVVMNLKAPEKLRFKALALKWMEAGGPLLNSFIKNCMQEDIFLTEF